MNQFAAARSTESGAHAGSAREVYEELRARTSNKRKRTNLERVWTALEHLGRLKTKDFSVAAVARAVDALGLPGPKAQSIRNADGRDFRELISAYAAESGDAEQAKRSSVDEQLVTTISDPKSREQVKLLLADNASLQYRIDCLKALVGNLSPVSLTRPEDGERGAAQTALPAPQGVAPDLSDREIGSIRAFIENVDQVECTWDEGSGALLDRDGYEVAPPAFLDALRKVIAGFSAAH